MPLDIKSFVKVKVTNKYAIVVSAAVTITGDYEYILHVINSNINVGPFYEHELTLLDLKKGARVRDKVTGSEGCVTFCFLDGTFEVTYDTGTTPFTTLISDNPERWEVFTQGLKLVREDQYCYGSTKSNSTPKKCDCDFDNLMRYGCKCGGV